MTLTIDTAEAMAGLALLVGRTEDPLPLMTSIGKQQVMSVQRRIRNDKITPWGSVWAPWRPSTERERQKKGNAAQGLVWDKGTLLNEIHFDAAPHEVAIGSDLPYAPFLQDGTPRMDARQYLGWDESEFQFIETLAMLYLETGL